MQIGGKQWRLGALALGLSLTATACGGTTEWVAYIQENDLVPRDYSGRPVQGELAAVTRTGMNMCRLMRDEGLSRRMVVLAFATDNPEADPYALEALAYGADRYLCDNVDYNQ